MYLMTGFVHLGHHAHVPRRRRSAVFASLAVALLLGLRGDAWTTLSAQAAVQTFDGILNVQWGDPRTSADQGGGTFFSLSLPDGTSVPLQFTNQENVAVTYFRKRVTVSGRQAQGAPAAQNAGGAAAARPAVVVDSIVPSAAQGNAAVSDAVFGTKKVIFLLLKFSDDSAVPHAPSFYTNLTNPDTPPAGVGPTTINGFYKKTSWNQFSWLGDVGGVGGVGASGGWLTLPQPKSYYAPCNFGVTCANTHLSELGDHGTALGRAQGINFTQFDNINFVLSNDLDCCAWGGSYFSSVDNKSYGATWEPPWGQNTVTYAHEMGHSLGMPHSGWVYFAYDSPWDMMSSTLSLNGAVCGSYVSRNTGQTSSLTCAEPGDGYIGAHLDFLGWLPTANQLVVTGGGGVSASLEAMTLPIGAAIKMIKICVPGFACSGSSARYFTVETRVKGLGATSQYDNAITGDGVVIHSVQRDRPAISGTCYFNSQSGWAVPIDATPGDYDSTNCNYGGRLSPNRALENAQWPVGSTYKNATYGFNVQVVSRSGSTFVVSVGSFTDDPLVAGTTSIKAAHITELRTRIDAARLKYGLGALSWPDSLVAGTTPIKIVHLSELRSALNAVYTQRSLALPTYTDPTLTSSTPIKAIHITELRSFLVAVE